MRHLLAGHVERDAVSNPRHPAEEADVKDVDGGAAGPEAQLAARDLRRLQKELQEAGDQGFDFCGQTLFQSAFGGKEVSVILERIPASAKRRIEFKLLATTKTSTMEKELKESGAAGFEFLEVIVGSTAIGGKEVVSILRRYAD